MLATKYEDAKREEGFTLIELLVVVIIIGILAAIAIPVFLNQRERAWNSAAQSDLRNAAIAQETYFTDNAEYTRLVVGTAGGEEDDPATTGLTDLGFRESANVTLTVPGINAENEAAFYCMRAVHDSGGEVWFLDSNVGAPVSESSGGSC